MGRKGEVSLVYLDGFFGFSKFGALFRVPLRDL